MMNMSLTRSPTWAIESFISSLLKERLTTKQTIARWETQLIFLPLVNLCNMYGEKTAFLPCPHIAHRLPVNGEVNPCDDAADDID